MEPYLKDELFEFVKKDQQLFDFIHENTKDGLLYLNPLNYSEYWANADFWKNLGYTDNSLPSDLLDCFSDKEQFNSIVSKFLDSDVSSQAVDSQKISLKHKNGSNICFQCKYYNIEGDTAQYIRLVIAFQNEQTDNALQESKKRYKSLFKNAPIPLWEEDFSEIKKQIDTLKLEKIEDFRTFFYSNPEFVAKCAQLIQIIDVNDAAIQLHEANSKEELLQGLDLIFTPKSYDAFTEELIAIAEGKRECSFESVVKTLEGKEIDIQLNWSIVPGYKKSLERIYISTSDITNLKLAETKIRESEQKLRLTIDNSPLGVATVDLNGKFITSNKTFEDITGYPTSELKKLTLFDITHSSDHSKNQNVFKKLISGQEDSFTIEKRYIRKDGELIHVRIHAGLVHDSKNHPQFALAFIDDITSQKQSETKLKKLYSDLKENKKRLNIAIEGAKIGTWELNLKSQVLITNEYWINSLGYTIDEIEETLDWWLAIIHPEDLPICKRKLIQYVNGRSNIYDVEMRVKNKFGKWIWIQNKAQITQRNKDGFPLKVSGVHINICERKEYENSIKQKNKEYQEVNFQLSKANRQLEIAKEKAEESNRLKSEFLHNMSHEIRTPMNGIMGFSRLIGDPETAPEKIKYYTSIIQNSSNQLLRIIDDILEISILETKQQPLINKPFCLNDFIMELFAIFDLKAKEKKIPLYINKNLSDIESTIISDKNKLNKVISNLIENALKFTNNGYIEIGYYLKEKDLILYVKDTGIGISKENKERIFDRFSQEHKGIAQSHGGLGLGLSIAKENAQLLGGRISVESEKGKGATFFVTIPYNLAENAVNILANQELIGNHLYTILIAEDEETNYLFIQTLLENDLSSNYQIIHAKNGKDALEICKANKEIDLVLMDIKMPEMSGYEATKQIKMLYPRLPIIVQTAYSSKADSDEAYKMGCDDFISKPIDRDIFYEIINKHLPIKTP
ncbi:PAS domain S-box protein [Prolixibacteraceae bacterium JC049]|nr:PAS domain S-box protein [Prolixibacteraceae bacterium JC049]